MLLRAIATAVSIILASSLAAADSTVKSHRDFRVAGEAAYERKDYAAAREAFAHALELRPDSPRYLHMLATLSALTGDATSALKYLNQLADLGVASPIERDRDLASLQGTPEFLRILQRFAENRGPHGEVEELAELPGRTGIIEGIAFRERTGDLFLGDVHHRCIWRRDRDGRVAQFTVDDEELFGVFGIAIDEARNTLWAATTALPEMSGFTPDMKGEAALAEFNLATSELRRIIPVPGDGREHGLGDLLIAPDGTIFATDSISPVVWKLTPGEEEMEKVVDSPVFSSLQGLALDDRTLLVADHATGLFIVDLATRNITSLPPPKNATLIGIDGIVVVPGGIVAIQNGVEPQRVIRVGLTPGMTAVVDVTVLAAGLPNLTDLSLITLANGRPTFIAGAGWDGFDPAKAKQPRAHTVRVFQSSLP
jgi:sugar lactone lactonase YvrE